MMLRAEDFQQAALPDIREQEQEALRALENRKALIAQQLDMGRRANALRMASGYTEFVKNVQDALSTTLSRMMTYQGDPHGLWELKGRAQAMNNVLALLTQTSSMTEALEKELQQVENDLAELRKRIPNQGVTP